MEPREQHAELRMNEERREINLSITESKAKGQK